MHVAACAVLTADGDAQLHPGLLGKFDMEGAAAGDDGLYERGEIRGQRATQNPAVTNQLAYSQIKQKHGHNMITY